ncbi:MAG: hypothetical protein ABFC63_11840 [Thermoguttaceae bacterium]
MANARTSIILLLVFIAAWAEAAGPSPTTTARKLLLRGKYAEAADLYAPLAAKDPTAAIGLSRCLAAQGKDNDAIEPLQAKSHATSADILAELSSLSLQHGRLDQARSYASDSLHLNDNQLLARWVTAELDRLTGKLDQADRGYAWLIRYYNDHEVEDPEQLRCIGLAAAQSARWNRQSDQFGFLVNDLYPDALQRDPDYWPAHYEAAMLFLEKYNQADAARELQAATEINPNVAEVHVALALLALEDRDTPKAEKALRRAIEINPHRLDARLLQADLLWAEFKVAETLGLLQDQALPLNPISEETLGRIAACYLLLDGAERPRLAAADATGKPAASRFAKLAAEVVARNPHAGEFYFTLAVQFEARNKQTLSEPYFREAIRRMPRQIGPESHLGLLYMLAGREDDARRTLRDAFRGDPFNVRVKNSLEVLDILDAMRSIDTRRFTVRSQTEDKLLARCAARHLERIYRQLCRRFGYQPPDKTVVEIFGQAQGLGGHQWFSARMVGLPYLDTVAASTGRIVGMVSPRELGRPMNWARVLTHETVHVITLQQTNFDCPRWFTEGLAVWSEAVPRPKTWCESLVRRQAQGSLLNLDTIHAGFTRPQASDDCAMAYCQGELYVEYMLTVRPSKPPAQPGEESLRQMLAAYADGLSTADALRRVFGLSQADFERGCAEFVKRQAAEMKKISWPSDSQLKKLRKAADDKPDDANAAAQLAQAAMLDADDLASRRILARSARGRKDDTAAERWASEALEIDVRDAEMHRILAHSLLKRHNETEAIVEYQTVLELKPGDAESASALERLKRPHNPK